MKKKDERIKLTNEVVTGIKYVKMSGWEEAFLSKVTPNDDRKNLSFYQVNVIRGDELRIIRKQFWTFSFFSFSTWMTPTLILTSVLAMYFLLGNKMTAEVAFTMTGIIILIQVSYFLRIKVITAISDLYA